jgi:hypothetical protein
MNENTTSSTKAGYVRRAAAAVLLGAVAMLSGCLEMTTSQTAICVLIDVSGTYADQKDEVVNILKREVIPSLLPGDTLITILIDSESYQQENVKFLTTLDARPSRANAQKLALSQALEALAVDGGKSQYTDIPGAMMLGAEYLQEAGGQTRVMLVFSDMREELPAGAKREMRKDEFAGIHLVAMNVKRLGADSADPAAYRERLDSWQTRVEAAGSAGWQVVMDAGKLGGVLEALRG